MDLKHIEEMAKDRCLTRAWVCSSLQDFWLEEFKDDYEDEDDFDLNEIREWNDLIPKEKEYLLEQAHYFWVEDESNAPVSAICNCVMLNQNRILDHKMDKWAFFRQLPRFW